MKARIPRWLVLNTGSPDVERICQQLVLRGLVEIEHVWAMGRQGFDDIQAPYDLVITLVHHELAEYGPVSAMLQQRYADVPLVLVDAVDSYDAVHVHRPPMLVFKQELLAKSQLIPGVRYVQFSRCADDHLVDKPRDIDISCLMGYSCARRLPFFEEMRKLQGQPRNVIAFGDSSYWGAPFLDVIQRSKIAVGYWGNGYDCNRTSQVLSCGTCLATPDDPLLSRKVEHRLRFHPDLHDLLPVLQQSLESGSWQEIGRLGHEEFLLHHTSAARAQMLYDEIMHSLHGER
jgi:hypothetical protein